MKKEVMTAVIEKSALSKAAEPIIRQTIRTDYTVLHIQIIFLPYILFQAPQLPIGVKQLW